MTSDHLAAPLLAVDGLSKRFGATQALDRVSLSIRPAEVHALVGENGAGKSTLVRLLAGMLAPDGGTMRFDGQSVRFGSPRAALDSGLGFIHQDFDLAPNLSVAANLLLNHEPTRVAGWIDRRSEREIAARLLERVGVELDLDQPVGELDAVHRQLLAIARSLGRSCRILVMDEPTSALAEEDIARLLALIRRLRQQGTTVLYISHRLEEIFAVCDRVTVLRDGRHAGTLDVGACTSAEVVGLMTGRDVAAAPDQHPPAPGAALLQVTELRTRRLRGLSFSLAQGEVLGLYGLKGSGRAALARALFGLEARTGGALHVGGAAVAIRRPRDAIRLGLAYAGRDRKQSGLIPNLDVGENLTIAALDRFSRLGFLRRRRERRAVSELLERFRVRTAGPHQPIGSLSGGNQQKLILARWLLIGPRVLILDEPTAGIDVGAKSDIYGLIRTLAAKGMGVLLITSEMPELLQLSDRVLVMHEGRWAGQFTRDQVSERAVMQAIFASAVG